MILVENKKARAEYTVLETFHAGIVLTGPEVKSLRLKNGSLQGSYVKVLSGECFLLGARITPYTHADNRQYDPLRTRKLLLKKREILQLEEHAAQKGKTLVPLCIELQGRVIKLQLAVAKGKKQFERREELKKRAVARDAQREVKQKIRWG